MRATPTVEYSAVGHWSIEYAGGTQTATGIVLDQPSPRVAAININVASGLTAGQGCQIMANSTTSARLGLSAEL